NIAAHGMDVDVEDARGGVGKSHGERGEIVGRRCNTRRRNRTRGDRRAYSLTAKTHRTLVPRLRPKLDLKRIGSPGISSTTAIEEDVIVGNRDVVDGSIVARDRIGFSLGLRDVERCRSRSSRLDGHVDVGIRSIRKSSDGAGNGDASLRAGD